MLTSQNNSRAATAPIASDILGEVRWYDESTEQSGEITINVPQCTIGTNPGCTLCLPSSGIADIHATLVFGKRFILLKAPYPTQLAGRQIRESLIDKITELTIGSVHIEVVPRHELGKKTKRPRVIRSQELAERASLLSQRDLAFESNTYTPSRAEVNESSSTSSMWSDNQNKDGIHAEVHLNASNEKASLAEERFVAIETTLGKLQSAVEIIQAQSVEPAPSVPVDLSQQLAAMGKSVAEELEQRLAARLDSQAASQATLVSQIRDEALRPIESTLDGLLTKLDNLSIQQIQTSDKLETLASATDFRLAEWDQWRESLVQQTEQDYSSQQDYGSQQPPQASDLNEVELLGSELHAPLSLNYPNDYFSQGATNQGPVDSDHEFPDYQENYSDNITTDYPESPIYAQNGFDSPTDFESRYGVHEHSFENEPEHDSYIPTNEPISWGESTSNVPSAWNATQDSYPFVAPRDSEIVENVASAYDEQPAGESYSSEGYGAYSTDNDSSNEIPILTTLENQVAGHDVYSNGADENDQSNYLPEAAVPSKLADAYEAVPEETYLDYQPESPLAAYLKSPLTELPSQPANEIPSSYSANLDSYLSPPEPQDESRYSPSILKDTPYEIADDSHTTIEESTEREVLREPTNELSIRLRQMLAEIKAEDEQSTNVEESESYNQSEIISDTQKPAEDEQIPPPSWLRDYAPSYPQEDEDRTMEMSNDSMETVHDLGAYDDRSYPSMVALDLDSTASLDAPPDIPSFDWNKNSLLSPENDVQESLLHHDVEEDQDDIDDDQSSSVLTSTDAAHPETVKDDREESIEEYMQKLLQRVKQGSDGAETPIEDLTVKSAPRSRREFLNRASKPVELDDVTHEPPKSGEPIPEPAKRPSPAQVDMDALRELANSNARRAIARSENKRANTTILIKVAITSFAIAAAALILLLNGFNMNPPFAGFVAALVVAFLWGTDCYKHFKALKDTKSAKPVTIDPPIAEDNAVRTGDDAEGGWRPSPI